MAINFAGGTDRISYAGTDWNAFTGCISFKLKTTQTTAIALPLSIWTTSSRHGVGFILNWHTIGFNWNGVNGGANALFVDGVSEATANSSANWFFDIPGTPLTLGGAPSFWASYVGDAAEVAVWIGRQLDVAEHEALGLPRNGFSPSKIAPSFLPLVRPARDRYGATMTGPTGTTVSDHGRVIYPTF